METVFQCKSIEYGGKLMLEEERNEVVENETKKKRKGEWRRFEISSWIFLAVLAFLLLIFCVDVWGCQSGKYTDRKSVV